MNEVSNPEFSGERLADFVVSTGWEELSLELRHEAKRSLLNAFGCALAVSSDATVETAIDVLSPFSGAPTATLVGRRERMDAMSASFVNAVAFNLLDYDDTHLNTVIHPTAVVAAPVLAMAEQMGLSGADVILAFVLGAEVECRIGNAVSPGHYARGWHITATCGVIGAAAGVAKLLQLTPQQTWHALGIAAGQSAGLVENLPSAAKNVGVGNAARNGLFAALLAQQGYTAAPAAIEGPRGWARAMGDEPVLEELTGQLGERWEFARNTYKPYPCGIVMHAIIDACLQLREDFGLAVEDIVSVVVRGDALLLARGDRAVHNERDGRVSIHHCVAAALIWRAGGVREFSEACVMDPRAVAFRRKVQAELEPDLPIGAATVTVRTAAGAEHQTTVHHARGSIETPLSDEEIETKVRDAARLGSSGCDVARLSEAIWRLDRATTIGDMMRLTIVPAG